MKLLKQLVAGFTAGLWLALLASGCGAPTVASDSGTATLSAADSGAGFLRVRGNEVVNDRDQPVRLKGMAFGNQVWHDRFDPRLHHGEIDYSRLQQMGMNAVRFYIHYRTLEDDDRPGQYKAEGWKWLDDNVAWAKKHGVYLILNMHVPPGGFQSQGAGGALWEVPSNQERLIDLWVAIAQRYRDEPIVAGYDLLNEPGVTRSKEQWRELSHRMIAAIRKVDPKHMIFIERVNSIAGNWGEDADRNFIKMDDPNVVYEFHFYKPFHFTHQSAGFVDFAAQNVVYPSEKSVGLEWFLQKTETGTTDNPRLPAGNSPWTRYEGKPFAVTDPKLVVGRPALVCDKAGSGKALFDDVVINRVNEAGTVLEELWRVNLDTNRGWYFYTENGSGKWHNETDGHGDSTALSISGTTASANLSAEIYRIRTTPRALYRIDGWMKGEEIPADAGCQIRLDFLSSDAPVLRQDKSFLAWELDATIAWGVRNNVPLYLGEWGTIIGSFADDNGGLRWVEDMLDLIDERKLHHTYHDYHEEWFGIYYGNDTLPDPENANTPLIELFTRKLQTRKPQ